MQGLLEIHRISGQEAYLSAVCRTADRVVSVYGAEGRVVSEIGENWEPLSSHLCLTGYAQMAIVLFELFGLKDDKLYLETGLKLLDDVAATQDVTSPGRPHYGGIKGSSPIAGRYAPLQAPNWATKFFIDALLTKQRVLNTSTRRPHQPLSAG
jgi:hypothetical protein